MGDILRFQDPLMVLVWFGLVLFGGLFSERESRAQLRPIVRAQKRASLAEGTLLLTTLHSLELGGIS